MSEPVHCKHSVDCPSYARLKAENEKLREALEAADALIQRMDEEADGFSRAVVVLDTEYRAARYLATGTAIPLTQQGGER